MEKKLFEIPIYGISLKDLLLKYDSKRQHFREKYVSKNGNGNPVKVEEYVNLVCHPHLLCNYNHIVGFVVITYDRGDICYKAYLQNPDENYKKSRYIWHSGRKWFIMDHGVGGQHFRASSDVSNAEIWDRLSLGLEGFMNDCIPQKYFVDLEAFNAIGRYVDYKAVIGNRQ